MKKSFLLFLLLFLCVMVRLFLLAREIRHRNRTLPWLRGVACGYMASLVGIFISGLTDHTLFNSQLGMLFWAGNAILLIADRLSGGRGGPSGAASSCVASEVRNK